MELSKKLDTKLDVIKEQTQQVKENIDDAKNQLDKDRVDLSRIRIDMATISEQNDQLIKALTDFKNEIRQAVQDAVRDEVGKAIKKELNKIGLENPRKVFFVKQSIIDRIKNKLRK